MIVNRAIPTRYRIISFSSEQYFQRYGIRRKMASSKSTSTGVGNRFYGFLPFKAIMPSDSDSLHLSMELPKVCACEWSFS